MGSHHNIHGTDDDDYYYCPRPDCPCHGAAPGIIFVHYISPDDHDLYRWAVDQYDRLFGSYDQQTDDDSTDNDDEYDLDEYDPAQLVADINDYLRSRANHPTDKPPTAE